MSVMDQVLNQIINKCSREVVGILMALPEEVPDRDYSPILKMLSACIQRLYIGDHTSYPESWWSWWPWQLLLSTSVTCTYEGTAAPECWIWKNLFIIVPVAFAVTAVFLFGFLVWVLTKVLRPTNANESKSKRKARNSRRKGIFGKSYETKEITKRTTKIKVLLTDASKTLWPGVPGGGHQRPPLQVCGRPPDLPEVHAQGGEVPSVQGDLPQGGLQEVQGGGEAAERLVRLRAQLRQ